MAIGTRQQVRLYIKREDAGAVYFTEADRVPGLMSVGLNISSRGQKYKLSNYNFNPSIPISSEYVLDFTSLLVGDQTTVWTLLVKPTDQANTMGYPVLGQRYDFQLVYGEFGQPDCVAFVSAGSVSTSLEVNASLPGVVQMHMTMAGGGSLWVYRGLAVLVGV